MAESQPIYMLASLSLNAQVYNLPKNQQSDTWTYHAEEIPKILFFKIFINSFYLHTMLNREAVA